MVIPPGAEPGPVQAPRSRAEGSITALIRTGCSLSNHNKERLSWKPALDVVQISESLPSPHLGYFPSFLFLPRGYCYSFGRSVWVHN